MPGCYLGLMSGTSMNGVDAAVVEFTAPDRLAIRGTATIAYPADLRRRLLCLVRDQPALTLAEFSELDFRVAESFAGAAQQALAQASLPATAIIAIGSHGQTVYHQPNAATPSSLQLGDPNLISSRTGLTVVADFRRRDIALHGQGAPLVPAFHHALFATGSEARCIVNIGGIANITVLDSADPLRVRGFDTGPGNGLMDEWAERCRGVPFDTNGTFANEAPAADAALLQALLADDYFRRPAPKSTGRDQFNLDWARRRHPALEQLPPELVQRTFCELTARTLADAIGREAPDSARVLVCGGGARNATLMRSLRTALAATPVGTTAEAGLDPDWVEAAAFAWLAMRTLENLPGNLPAVTGAERLAVLGGIYRA